LHFKRESIDELVAKQKETLDSCASYVADEGNLVYMVSTINRKEGRSLIMDFLDRHRDFTLIEEKQRFPFDSLDTALYYAIMKRKVEALPSE
jgi:16S rRNA C967 or C1407 C5-methylase (RsmB/RsmF family)